MRGGRDGCFGNTMGNARVAHLLLVCRMMTIRVDNGQEEKFDVNDYDSLMYTLKAETIEPFTSHIVFVKTGKAYVGECINIMVQAHGLRMVPCPKI